MNSTIQLYNIKAVHLRAMRVNVHVCISLAVWNLVLYVKCYTYKQRKTDVKPNIAPCHRHHTGTTRNKAYKLRYEYTHYHIHMLAIHTHAHTHIYATKDAYMHVKSKLAYTTIKTTAAAVAHIS